MTCAFTSSLLPAVAFSLLSANCRCVLSALCSLMSAVCCLPPAASCLPPAPCSLLAAELTCGIVRCMGADLTGHLALDMGPELTASIVHWAGVKNIGKLVAQVSRRLLWVYSE